MKKMVSNKGDIAVTHGTESNVNRGDIGFYTIVGFSLTLITLYMLQIGILIVFLW